MLVLQRKSGQSIVINENITLTILEINGDKVKLAIDAPKEIPILRSELIEAALLNAESAISSNKSIDAIKNFSKFFTSKPK